LDPPSVIDAVIGPGYGTVAAQGPAVPTAGVL
jgi:hypothetical protein